MHRHLQSLLIGLMMSGAAPARAAAPASSVSADGHCTPSCTSPDPSSAHVPSVRLRADAVLAQPAQGTRGPISAFDSAKMHALLRTRLPCLGCHVVGDAGGRIGPDLTHVATRRSAAYIRDMVTDPGRTVPGTLMPRIPMPAQVRELLIAYLSANAASAHSTPRPTPPTPIAAHAVPLGGAVLYARHCVACHGARGMGDGPNARFLPVRPAVHADPGVMSTRSDDRLYDAIHGGGYPLGRSAQMPAFGATLSPADIWQLVAHLRSLCRCQGPAWSHQAPR